MRRVATLCLSLAVLAGCAGLDPAPEPAPHAVLLVSLDGFRPDFVERAPSPVLDGLIERGVRAERMIGAFPTKTFPNHYTIVTGLYPGHHGIVANNIWDPVFEASYALRDRAAVADGRWYGGEPIWVTAEKSGVRSAPFFWPGAEAEIAGYRPTYWKRFDDDLPDADRVDQILGWLDLPVAERPRFLTLYSSEMDSTAHRVDPDNAPEIGTALQRLDRFLGRLVDGLAERGLLETTDLVIVSDHGMAATSPERAIALDDYIDLGGVRISDWNPVAAIWPEPEAVDEVYAALAGKHPALAVYRKAELPARFHYSDHRRVAPIVAVADDGWTITSRDRLESNPHWFAGGNHGYDPSLESMGALFVAAGPSFARGATVEPFENVHLYELFCHLLDLPPAPNDGSLEAVRHLLR